MPAHAHTYPAPVPSPQGRNEECELTVHGSFNSPPAGRNCYEMLDLRTDAPGEEIEARIAGLSSTSQPADSEANDFRVAAYTLGVPERRKQYDVFLALCAAFSALREEEKQLLDESARILRLANLAPCGGQELIDKYGLVRFLDALYGNNPRGREATDMFTVIKRLEPDRHERAKLFGEMRRALASGYSEIPVRDSDAGEYSILVNRSSKTLVRRIRDSIKSYEESEGFHLSLKRREPDAWAHIGDRKEIQSLLMRNNSQIGQAVNTLVGSHNTAEATWLSQIQDLKGSIIAHMDTLSEGIETRHEEALQLLDEDVERLDGVSVADNSSSALLDECRRKIREERDKRLAICEAYLSSQMAPSTDMLIKIEQMIRKHQPLHPGT